VVGPEGHAAVHGSGGHNGIGEELREGVQAGPEEKGKELSVENYIADVDLSLLSPRERARFEVEVEKQQKLTEEAKEEISKCDLNARVMMNEPMANHTPLGVGGAADALLEIDDREDLEEAMAFAAEKKIPHVFLEDPDKVIVRDKGIRGLVIMLKSKREFSSPGTLSGVFQDPEGPKARALIGEAGLGGIRVGRVRVGAEDMNGIVNEGGAKARDAIVLINLIREKVKQSTGLLLKPAVKIVGEE
jgi:hypothetical protein